MPTTLATYAVSSVSTIKTGSLVKIPVFKGAKGDLGAISTAIFGTGMGAMGSAPQRVNAMKAIISGTWALTTFVYMYPGAADQVYAHPDVAVTEGTYDDFTGSGDDEYAEIDVANAPILKFLSAAAMHMVAFRQNTTIASLIQRVNTALANDPMRESNLIRCLDSFPIASTGYMHSVLVRHSAPHVILGTMLTKPELFVDGLMPQLHALTLMVADRAEMAIVSLVEALISTRSQLLLHPTIYSEIESFAVALAKLKEEEPALWMYSKALDLPAARTFAASNYPNLHFAAATFKNSTIPLGKPLIAVPSQGVIITSAYVLHQLPMTINPDLFGSTVTRDKVHANAMIGLI